MNWKGWGVRFLPKTNKQNPEGHRTRSRDTGRKGTQRETSPKEQEPKGSGTQKVKGPGEHELRGA